MKEHVGLQLESLSRTRSSSVRRQRGRDSRRIMRLTTATSDGECAKVAAPPPLTPQNHACGLALIFLVSVIWVASAELVQYIFAGASFSKPYFLTYITTGLSFLFLLGFLVSPAWRAAISAPRSDGAVGRRASGGDEADSAGTNSPVGSTVGAVDPPKTVAYNAAQVRSIAFSLAPIYFIANYTFNAGLISTSVASSSTISMLSVIYGLALGALTGVERFSLTKLVAACLTVVGVAIISWYDTTNSGIDSLYGDAISVLSAFLFGLYATQLKKHMPDEAVASMAMLFGFMGGLIAVAGWPIFFILHWTGAEKFQIPSGRVTGLLALDALVGSVLSDYLWARAITLTTPVIATLALSLSLPLSVGVDYFVRGRHFSWAYFVGVVIVLTGFVAANLDEALSSRKSRQESSVW
jgi:solute carrier family 35, member F5